MTNCIVVVTKQVCRRAVCDDALWTGYYRANGNGKLKESRKYAERELASGHASVLGAGGTTPGYAFAAA